MMHNIKNSLLLFVGAITILIGCTHVPEREYSLKGTIQGLEGEKVYLSYMVNDSIRLIDSVQIQNSAFTFSGVLEKPYQLAHLYMGDLMNFRNSRRMRIYLEPTSMTIEVDTARFTQSKIMGSVGQLLSDSLNVVIAKIRSEMNTIIQTMEAETDADKRLALEKVLENHKRQVHQTYIDFIRLNPHSYIALDNLTYLLGDLDYVELNELYSNLDEKVKQFGDVSNIESELQALKLTQPGQLAPDFLAMGTNGEPIRFSETVKDKYVILDFWASWCMPCRKSMPHLKELYKSYRDKGLVVFCVADNDKSEKKWRDAINKDGTEEFFHVYYDIEATENKGYNKNISKKYGIHYLPTKYLIDKDFKIVGKFNDAELDAKLRKIFGE